jgi:hypothetical protein
MGPARRAERRSAPAGVAPAWGVVERAAPRGARPRQRPQSCIVPGGDSDRGESPGAGHAGQLDGITAGRVDPRPRLLGHQRRGHAPAGVAFCLERARAKRHRGLLQRESGAGARAAQGVESALARAARAPGGDRSARRLCHVRDRTRLFVDLHAAAACARLGPG